MNNPFIDPQAMTPNYKFVGELFDELYQRSLKIPQDEYIRQSINLRIRYTNVSIVRNYRYILDILTLDSVLEYCSYLDLYERKSIWSMLLFQYSVMEHESSFEDCPNRQQILDWLENMRSKKAIEVYTTMSAW